MKPSFAWSSDSIAFRAYVKRTELRLRGLRQQALTPRDHRNINIDGLADFAVAMDRNDLSLVGNNIRNHAKPPYWTACFRDGNGHQRRPSLNGRELLRRLKTWAHPATPDC